MSSAARVYLKLYPPDAVCNDVQSSALALELTESSAAPFCPLVACRRPMARACAPKQRVFSNVTVSMAAWQLLQVAVQSFRTASGARLLSLNYIWVCRGHLDTKAWAAPATAGAAAARAAPRTATPTAPCPGTSERCSSTCGGRQQPHSAPGMPCSGGRGQV